MLPFPRLMYTYTMADNNLDILKNVSKDAEIEKGKHGGRRPGAGRAKGSVNKATKEMKEARKAFIERVNKNVDKLFNAQLDLAIGEKYLMVIKTVGKGAKQRRETSIVTDPELIKQYLDDELEVTDEEYYFMTTKPANNQALDSLLNRSFGKPTDKVDVTSNGETLRGATITFSDRPEANDTDT